MKETVLITGGAGFIGKHLVSKLIQENYRVRILDNFSEQVHGQVGEETRKLLERQCEVVVGDVRNREDVERALTHVDLVIHLAAETGVGQSMYEVSRHTSTNIGGTAVLLEVISNASHEIGKIVLSSSRAIYGEGKYACQRCGQIVPSGRTHRQLSLGLFEPVCPLCGTAIRMLPTDETTPAHPQSVYAITKQTQEELVHCIGQAIHVPFTVLRYYNVYGEGQALHNPYTGILSSFATRILAGAPPVVYEDGLESRDFVHVDDVATATLLSLKSKSADHQVLNIGSGKNATILEVARLLVRVFKSNVEPVVSRQFRLGDIRHSLADISKASTVLGYNPRVSLEEGVGRFAHWAKDQVNIVDLTERAAHELESRNLLGSAAQA